MKHKISRKVLSCILAVVMIFGISATAFAADSEYKNPIVVVNGIANNPLFANPNSAGATQVFPPDNMTSLELTTEMFVSGLVAISSNDYEQVMNYFVGSKLYEKFEAIQLNPDGTSKSENLGPITYDHSLSYYTTDTEQFDVIAGTIGKGMCERVGYDKVYVYTYDWRLDPIENAKGLDEFIQTVKTQSRKEQVSIISEGYGSTIATTYLAECYENATADVDNFVTVNSAFEGSSVIGDLFTGRLLRQYNELNAATSAFIRYTNDFSDNPATWFATWLTNYILNKNWETQAIVNDIITMMGHVRDDLYDKYLRDLLKNFTGLWALVPVEYFEEAMDFMFINDLTTDEDYNSEFQEKLQAFKNYQTSAPEILNRAKSEGINISVISCWNIQIVPIGDNKASEDELFGLSAQSDGLIDTYYSSFGATTIPLNDVGAAIQNKNQRYKEGECANHNHLSAEFDTLNPELSLSGIAHYIDASTCALPDNTWFIRNMKYGTFDAESNSFDLLVYLTTTDKTTSVFSNVLYPQFMNYNRYVKPGYMTIPDYGNMDGNYLLGDVDLDGKVTAVDARLVLRMVAHLEPYPPAGSVVFKNADVNGNGRITAVDARIILRVVAALATFDDYITDDTVKA